MRKVHGLIKNPLESLFHCATRYLTASEALDMLMSGVKLNVVVTLKNNAQFRATINEYDQLHKIIFTGLYSTYVVQVPQEVAGAWTLLLNVTEIITTRCLTAIQTYERLDINLIQSISIEEIVCAGMVLACGVTHDAGMQIPHAQVFEMVITFEKVVLAENWSIEYVEIPALFETELAQPAMKLYPPKTAPQGYYPESKTFTKADAIAHGPHHPLNVIGVELFPIGNGSSIMFYPNRMETENLLTASA